MLARLRRVWQPEARIVTQPWLGLATTRELMEELVARGILGEQLIQDQDDTTLNYRTVDAT